MRYILNYTAIQLYHRDLRVCQRISLISRKRMLRFRKTKQHDYTDKLKIKNRYIFVLCESH